MIELCMDVRMFHFDNQSRILPVCVCGEGGAHRCMPEWVCDPVHACIRENLQAGNKDNMKFHETYFFQIFF